jgi:hypothetical protein
MPQSKPDAMKLASLLLIPLLALPLCASAQGAGVGRNAAGATATQHHHVVRADSARLAFMREHPCPATGQFTTNCPGWRVEFIVPPERGGADLPSNLRWERTDVTRPAD